MSLVARSLRGILDWGGGQVDGAGADVLDICGMLCSVEEQREELDACRVELAQLAEVRGVDLQLGAEEGLDLLRAAEIVAGGKSEEGWVRKMLERIRPGATVKSSESADASLYDELVGHLLEAFVAYGCTRGPLIECALLQLELYPDLLPLGRIALCVQVFEGLNLPQGSGLVVPIETVARAVTIQLSRNPKPSSSLLIKLVTFLSRSFGCFSTSTLEYVPLPEAMS